MSVLEKTSSLFGLRVRRQADGHTQHFMLSRYKTNVTGLLSLERLDSFWLFVQSYLLSSLSSNKTDPWLRVVWVYGGACKVSRKLMEIPDILPRDLQRNYPSHADVRFGAFRCHVLLNASGCVSSSLLCGGVW